MSKYDYIFKSTDLIVESLNEEESVAAIAVITAIIDGGIEDLDVELLADILWEFELFGEYAEVEILDTVDRLLEIAQNYGLGSLFNAANAGISDEVILDGFAAAVIMLLDAEDLIIPPEKKSYLQALQVALELEDEEAEEIIKQVIAAIEAGDEEEYIEEDYQPIIFNESGEQFYQSPLGNFTVPIPLDSLQGGRMQTQAGMVSFSDDLGTLFRIDYYPLSSILDDVELEGYERYLHRILVDRYVPQAIIANIHNAEVKYTEYLQDTLERYYYVLVDMPKGSTISKQETNGNGIRLDAYRGLLCFISNEFLYIVSSQRSFINGETPGTLKEEAEKIKQTILDFVATMEFT